MIDAELLLTDTKKHVVSLIHDLRTVAERDMDAAAHVATEYQRAHAAGRTAFGQAEWAEGLYAQVAVAWVLGCVFVRFCEDNELIEDPLLGGPGIRSQIALDHRAAHLQANPAHDDRQWLREVFGRLRALPATGEIFGSHNPVWVDGLIPSADAARKLREELTRLDPETAKLRHDFTDPAWDTRFLGDLYQDLSVHAKKTYALLQTPIFVEEFILDRTLEPALATVGLRETTVIDPTCGSGHFLLGAFRRLFEKWSDAEPGTNPRELARRAADAVAGIDLNPFAVAIARFRLLAAALRAGGDSRLADAPEYPIHIAVGDSLLHGDPPGQLAGMSFEDDDAGAARHGYATEDVDRARLLLTRQWTVVVGNPPYITVKDPALNELYRRRFATCHGKYHMSVPFTERFFQLARSDGDRERAGYVGMITDRAFMNSKFGKKLVEHWVPRHDLVELVDTSGINVAGHGTPTVILFGRNRVPTTSTVRAALALRGEPSRLDEPEKGSVWLSILEFIDQPGSGNEFMSVVDLDRSKLAKHPWSIGGGGAAELKTLLDERGRPLGSMTTAIGVLAISGMDEVALQPFGAVDRLALPASYFRPLVQGEVVRDWAAISDKDAYFPYDAEELRGVDLEPRLLRFLWPYRTTMGARATFSKRTYKEEGRPWWEWHQVSLARLKAPLSIVFAFKATHNHFALDRGGRVFKQSALLVKLPEGAGEERHYEVLAVLNSSTACFWLQQVCRNTGGPGGGSSKGEKWHDFYEFDGTKLQTLPVPHTLHAAGAETLDLLAAQLVRLTPSELVRDEPPTTQLLAEAGENYARLRADMIAAQERLDWETYRGYGLTDDDTTIHVADPPLQLGERAFEIVLARRIASTEIETRWFTKLGIEPRTELPEHWSDSYRRVVERRIELIEVDLNIGLIERPEMKRRWEQESWHELVDAAVESWLLDRLESANYWPEPATITTVARMAAQARADSTFVQVAQVYAGRDDVDVAGVVERLVVKSAVPYLAPLRYTEVGIRKFEQWSEVWDLQRREDIGDDVSVISPPPTYAKEDFRGLSWEHRGKLDVPKERFISYQGAQRETDASAVVGRAGWNHLDRARALAAWYLQARRDGRDPAHLTPLLGGLAELVPWLMQWYDDPNPDPALDRPGTQIAALVDTEMRSLGLTPHDLTAWRPEQKRSGRPKNAAT